MKLNKKKKNESRRYKVCRLLVSRVYCFFKSFPSVSSMLEFFWKMTSAQITNLVFQSKRNKFLNCWFVFVLSSACASVVSEALPNLFGTRSTKSARESLQLEHGSISDFRIFSDK